MKPIATLIFVSIFILGTNTFASFEVCINSQIYSGISHAIFNAGPEQTESMNRTERLVYRLLGDQLAGHAFIEVLENESRIRSYGYYPEFNLVIDEDYLDKGMTGEEYVGETSVQTRVARKCFPVTEDQVTEIERLAELYEARFGAWTKSNNCVNFAAYIFQTITHINLRRGLPLPRVLFNAISQVEGHQIYGEPATQEVFESKDSEVIELSGEAVETVR